MNVRSQDRKHQRGLSLVSILGVLFLLIVMAGVVYLFLPVDETALLQPSKTINAPSENDAGTDFSPAELQQLQPSEDADPELKQIAEDLAKQKLIEQQGTQGADGNLGSSTTANSSASGQSVEQNGDASSPALTGTTPIESSSGAQTALSTQWTGSGGLAGSDTKVRDSIEAIDPSQTMLSWLIGEELIRHFVVLTDNLANGAIPSKQMVFKSPKGSLAVEGAGEDYVLSVENYSRYQGYTQLLSKLPAETVIHYYQQFYPLMQQAYRELGYPKRSFHHRLLEAVEVVLNAPMPNPGQEIRLKRPSVMYTYADESLQAGSDVEKLLLRMGPENAVLLKESLWQLKRLLIQLDHR